MNASHRFQKTVVYIPSYRCEKSIISVLNRLPQELKDHCLGILVVDNASNDRTEELVMEYKIQNNMNHLHVLKLCKNVGYGGSQKIGYLFAVENKADAVIMVHGDGQYAPELAISILEPVIESQSDFVFGSRIAGAPLKGGMPLHRYLGNKALTLFQNIFLSARLTEYHSGYRAYNVNKLPLLNFEMMSDDYHFDTEMIIQLLTHKLNINEVVIPTHYGDEENHVNIWKYGIDVVITTLTYFFHKVGVRKSKNWDRIIHNTQVEERKKFLLNFLPYCHMNGMLLNKSSLSLRKD